MRWAHDADPEELAALAPGARPGASTLVGAASALAAAHLGTLDCPNVAVESALRRLLTTLFLRISSLHTGDLDEWEDRFDALAGAGRLDPTAVTAYTSRWAEHLCLFAPDRPFLQDPRLAAECGEAAPAGKLSMIRASGSNQPWMDRTPQQAPLSGHEALWWVLAWRGYGPCGLGAQRAHEGIKHKSMAAGPLRAAISWHPCAGSEFHSLLLSCPPPDIVPVTGDDLPEWEQEALPDPLRPQLPSGPVTRLINRPAHAVLAVADVDARAVSGCWVAWRTPVPSAIKSASGRKALSLTLEAVTGATDPFLISRLTGGPVRANHHRAMLRDFDTLIHARRHDATTNGAALPVWIRLLDGLPADVRERIGPVRARALGCHQDKQEKDELWYAATTPAPIAAYLAGEHPDRASRVARTREAAEGAASALAGALRSAWRAMSPDPHSECAWLGTTMAAYWDRAEPRFWQAIASGTDPDLRALAIELYDEATRADAASMTGLIPIAEARAGLVHPRKRRKPKAPAA
ncbi:type I-E CRISPR-associated protein Cse1/CasA [Streptomyces sp. NBC_00006]|uniref:type I-E CRISPR-associated protein Cse1/CasA n=1 Tax=Streptomyces sp. NBC_00006 TaxID=2975619 RepID=UPI00224CA5D0|nr:type I-E CRISPR-associated protein Cse1/CasA [Streptomyces sp. NBC_00006]MCX5535180.1 type I-E CRISPR-associated protein Cse1/CasA [Streptomyces sp. NBC_00006]